MDIQTELSEFSKECEEVHNKEFKEFNELEAEYCRLINKGSELRSYVLAHPEICSANTIMVLNNETTDLSIIEDEYKSLLNVLYLKKELLYKYQDYITKLKEEKKYDILLKVYYQMFKFNPDYTYLLEAATLCYEKLGRHMQASLIMWEIEPHLKNNPKFYWEKAKLYDGINKYYHSLLCMKKAVDLEPGEKANA